MPTRPVAEVIAPAAASEEGPRCRVAIRSPNTPASQCEAIAAQLLERVSAASAQSSSSPLRMRPPVSAPRIGAITVVDQVSVSSNHAGHVAWHNASTVAVDAEVSTTQRSTRRISQRC